MDNQQIQIIFQLSLALILGALIGLEREYKGKGAGLQTYSLVSLGSCLFTLVSYEIFSLFIDVIDKPGLAYDPSRVILAIATGIGFIGAGVIIYRQSHIEGLTTAAGLWAVAAIGLTVGMKFYFMAITATLLAIIILVVFGELERLIFGKDK